MEFKWSSKAGSSNIIQRVACGDLFTLFLTTSGEVYSCGVGECSGRKVDENSYVAERVDGMVGLYLTQIAAGSSHALALSSRGQLFGWGSNSSGQLGLGDDSLTNVVKIPTLVPIACNDSSGRSVGLDDDPVVGVAAGYSHSLCWSRGGRLLGSGGNKYGQLGLFVPRATTFTEISVGWGFCKAAACGSNHSLSIMQSAAPYSTGQINSMDVKSTDNSADPIEFKIFGWGQNNFGQILPDSTAPLLRQSEELVSINSHWQEVLYISAGGEQSFAAGIEKRSVSDHDFSFCEKKATSFMKRQFSTRASHAVLPVDAAWVLRLTERVLRDGEADAKSELLVAMQDIFSSPPILAASFVTIGNALQLDVLGLEDCYKTLLRIPDSVVLSRLLQAMETLIGDVLQQLTSQRHDQGQEAVQGQSQQVLRLLLILWQCPALALANRTASLFRKMVKVWTFFKQQTQLLTATFAAAFPPHILASRILKPLQDHLSHCFASNGHSLVPSSTSSSDDDLVPAIFDLCDLIKQLFEWNSTAQMLPNTIFYNDTISDISDEGLLRDFVQWVNSDGPKEQKQASDSTGKALCSYPFLLSLQAKKRLLALLARSEQGRAQQTAAQLALQNGQPIFMPFFLVAVRRSNLLQDAMTLLAIADGLMLKKPLKVSFEGEEGVDEVSEIIVPNDLIDFLT